MKTQLKGIAVISYHLCLQNSLHMRFKHTTEEIINAENCNGLCPEGDLYYR